MAEVYKSDEEYIFKAEFDEDYGLRFMPTGESVTRCKDCKWIDLCKDPEHYEYKGANGFCSKGGRKDGVEE